MIWYCDASAIVKRYVQETGSRWVRREIDHHQVVVAHISVVEVHAALSARYRAGTISVFSLFQARNNFSDHIKRNLYQVRMLTQSIVATATSLLPHHLLRAYDAVQLATALDFVRSYPAQRARFRFLTADEQLERAALGEGLKTEDHSHHRR